VNNIIFFIPIIAVQETVGAHAESQWLGEKPTTDAEPFNEIRQRIQLAMVYEEALSFRQRV
jgi:hypothetical protein